MKIHFLLAPLFLLLSLSIEAQTKLDRIDSIYQFALTNQVDSSALDALNNALVEIYSDNSDTAIFYAKKQVEISRQRGWRNFEAIGLLMIGVSMEFSGNLDTALGYYLEARNLGIAIGDSIIQLSARNSLGRVYSLKGMYQLSTEETLKAVALVENQRDPVRTASLLNSVALRFMELNRPEQSVTFLRRALSLNENLGDTLGQVSNSSNLGKAYLKLRNTDSSLYFYRHARRLSGKIGNRFQHMQAHSGLSKVFLELNLLDSAQSAKDTSENIAYVIKDATGIHEADYIQGLIYLERKQYRMAITYLEAALDWFEAGDFKASEIDILEALSRAYDFAGDYQKALTYLQRLNQLKDDIYLKQRDMAMAQVEFYRQEQQEKETELLNNKIALSDRELEYQTGLRNLFFLVGLLFLILLALSINRYMFERKTKRLLAEKNALIEVEKDRSENLLLNILPAEVASELKDKGSSDARHFDQVSVLFSDFVGFTELSAKLTPAELVQEIDKCFKAFDEIMTRHNLEKIKTIGDAYMAAGGLTDDDESRAADVVIAGLEMQEFIEERHKTKDERGEPAFRMRVGVHTGPVVAGIVGLKKFQYDIWGDTVNTASRMESHGEVGKVNVSDDTYELIKGESEFTFESRGKLAVKGKGEMEMLFVSLSNNHDDE